MSKEFQTLRLCAGFKAILGFTGMLFLVLPVAEAQPTTGASADIEEYLEALHTRDERAIKAAERLGNLGVEAAAAIPALNEAVKDEKHPELQRAAVRALAGIGPLAVPVLVEAVASSDHNLRRIARKAVSLLEPPAEAAAAICRELTNPDPVGRRAAATALSSFLAQEGVVKALQATLNDAHPGVREAAASSLAADPVRAQAALPALIDGQIPVAVFQRKTSDRSRSRLAAGGNAFHTSRRQRPVLGGHQSLRSRLPRHRGFS